MSTCTGSYKLLKIVRFFGPPCRIDHLVMSLSDHSLATSPDVVDAFCICYAVVTCEINYCEIILK